MDSFFSVIVPVYNVEKYLEECIESVLGQSMRNYELILVDDGSVDSSGAICDRYAAKDSRVVVIHKKNGGSSSARNAGIDKACGRFLWFLDSDDFIIEPDAFEAVRNNIVERNSDICVFPYRKYWQDKNHFARASFTDSMRDADVIHGIKTGAYKAVAWNKAVSRLLVINNDMRFPEGKLVEDLSWCADLLCYSENVSFCNKCHIAYRQRDGSITKTVDSSHRKKLIGDAISLIEETIRKYPKDFKDGLVYHYLSCEYVFLLVYVYPYWGNFKTQIKELEFLLDFTLSKKSYMASQVKNLFGLHITALLLNRYSMLKKLLKQ